MRPDSFHARVYEIVRAIPRGKVLGYGQVASMIGAPRAARQVGWALAALPAGTDVPWHRVIRSSGAIAAEGDVHRALLQRALLVEEGVEFVPTPGGDGLQLAMARYGWRPGDGE